MDAVVIVLLRACEAVQCAQSRGVITLMIRSLTERGDALTWWLDVRRRAQSCAPSAGWAGSRAPSVEVAGSMYMSDQGAKSTDSIPFSASCFNVVASVTATAFTCLAEALDWLTRDIMASWRGGWIQG